MVDTRERRYWDSCCFIAILNSEEPHASVCQRLLDEAKRDRIELLISPLTMAETVRPRGASAPIPLQHQRRILDFFENDYIRLRVIDRLIAKRSLTLCWNEGLHPKDALHLAVALEEHCEALETTDPHLLRLNGLEGMAIRHPLLEEQTDWIDGK